MGSQARAKGGLTTTEVAVLGLIAWRAMSGYDLLRAVENSLRHFWTPARSRVYEILPRLEERGLVRSRPTRSQAGPDKTVYRVTPAGRAALRAWIDADTEAASVRSPFLLKLFFGDFTSTDRIQELIHDHRRETEALLSHLEHCEAEAAPDDPHAMLTIRYGIHRARATLAWIEEAQAPLATQPSDERAGTP